MSIESSGSRQRPDVGDTTSSVAPKSKQPGVKALRGIFENAINQNSTTSTKPQISTTTSRKTTTVQGASSVAKNRAIVAPPPTAQQTAQPKTILPLTTNAAQQVAKTGTAASSLLSSTTSASVKKPPLPPVPSSQPLATTGAATTKTGLKPPSGPTRRPPLPPIPQQPSSAATTKTAPKPLSGAVNINSTVPKGPTVQAEATATVKTTPSVTRPVVQSQAAIAIANARTCMQVAETARVALDTAFKTMLQQRTQTSFNAYKTKNAELIRASGTLQLANLMTGVNRMPAQSLSKEDRTNRDRLKKDFDRLQKDSHHAKRMCRHETQLQQWISAHAPTPSTSARAPSSGATTQRVAIQAPTITFPMNGIVNPGLSCYLLATLQGLVRIPYFRDFIRPSGSLPTREAFIEACEVDCNNRTSVQKQLVASYLKGALHNFFVKLQHNAGPVSVTDLLDLQLDIGLAEKGKGEKLAADLVVEHDAEEFLGELLDFVGFPLSKFKKVSKYTIADTVRPIHQAEDAQAYTLQLSLQKAKAHSLQGLIAGSQFSSKRGDIPDKYYKEAQVALPRLDERDIACTRIDYAQLNQDSPPELLPIQLKRFDFDAQTGDLVKLNNSVSIPQEIAIKKAGGDQITYSFCAVVIHAGDSIEAGHYYTYACDPNKENSWCRFNDDGRVVETAKDVFLDDAQKNGYVFFYRLKEH